MKVLIHSSKVDVTKRHREFMKNIVQSRFKRFDHAVDKVNIYIKDVNGPKGGIDKECTLSINGKMNSEIVVTSRSDNLFKVVKACMLKARTALIKRIKKAPKKRQTILSLGYESLT